jgi:hypothetical protein
LVSLIKTYGRRGTAKFQDPRAYSQHAIIYSDESLLERLTPDQPYTKHPICVIPADPSTILNQKSRLNFGKPIAVEHNIRMKNIGRISADHVQQRLLRYFDEEHNTNYAHEENLASPGSRRKSSGHTLSQHRREGSIPEHGLYDYEDSGQAENEERSRTTRQRSRNTSSGYPDPARQVNERPSHPRREYGEEVSRMEQSRTPVAAQMGSCPTLRPAQNNRSQPKQYPPDHYS